MFDSERSLVKFLYGWQSVMTTQQAASTSLVERLASQSACALQAVLDDNGPGATHHS